MSIVYFHGLGSSPQTEKVEILRRNCDTKVFAPNLRLDYIYDAQFLIQEVRREALLEDLHATEQVVFCGTSLGAYWADVLGKCYGVPRVLINPCIDPVNTLPKLGVDEQTARMFDHIKLDLDDHLQTFFFSENDEVIPNQRTRDMLADVGYDNWYVVDGPDHQFNGHYFEHIAKYINNRWFN